jgi:hypothetical protein
MKSSRREMNTIITDMQGVHATLDASNRVRFGPDVEWLAPETKPDEIDYQPDERRGDSFYGMFACMYRTVFLCLFRSIRSDYSCLSNIPDVAVSLSAASRLLFSLG